MSSPFIDEKHYYDADSLGDSVCRVRILNGKDVSLVICTELPENGGTSITNIAAPLAKEFVEKYNLDGNNLLYIEHYAYPNEPEEFALVSMNWTGHKFTQPCWETLPIEEFKQVLKKFVDEAASPEALDSFSSLR